MQLSGRLDYLCVNESLNFTNFFTLDTRRETPEGLPQDHVTTDNGEGKQGDTEDLRRHQAHGKESADVEGACCCPTCYLGVKGMSE